MILITGTTGKTGGETAKKLAEAGVPFRTIVRNPEKTGPLEALGAEIVIGDVGDPATLDKAFAGVSHAILIMPNGEDQLDLEKQFTDRAKAAGVKHLVKLSSLEAIPESNNPITKTHCASEDHIRASGLDWTMIRPTFFMQNFLGSAARIRDNGMLAFPVGQGTVSATDLRDVAEVFVKVVTEDGHAGKSYDLTGPDLLTFAEIAEVFSNTLGYDVKYIDMPMDKFAEVLSNIYPEWRVNAICGEFEAIANGSVDHTTDGIPNLLGRPATSLAQFIEDHRPVFEKS